MMHKTIQIKNLSLAFSHKTCFQHFNTQISYGSRIAIIGRNGSGKSSLLKILQGQRDHTSGGVLLPEDAHIGYVPQVIEDFNTLSGGERFNKALTEALSVNPNILLLDEPTNHLDHHNRKSLMRLLKGYSGTLIIVSHDVELLRHHIDTLWHINNNKIQVFTGNYDDYKRELQIKRTSMEQELSKLERQKKELHESLMKEQERAAKSRAKGEKSIERKKWPTIVSKAKMGRSLETSGRKKAAIDQKREEVNELLESLRLPEEIIPSFSLSPADIGYKTIISITDGTIGYAENKPLINNLRFSLHSKDRIAINGKNGCGKSTFIKAMLEDVSVTKSGQWDLPSQKEVGVLDQHYATLLPEKTPFQTIASLVPCWKESAIRRHLNAFLFRKNEEVNAKNSTLSGGERARLSLAMIAASTPKLLILDEITNNLDLETREYVIQVLKNYPGAMIVISHDQHFLEEIAISDFYEIKDGCLFQQF